MRIVHKFIPIKGTNIVPTTNRSLRALHDRLCLIENVLTADQVKKINVATEKIKAEKKALSEAKAKISASGFRYSQPNVPVAPSKPSIGLSGQVSLVPSVGASPMSVGTIPASFGAINSEGSVKTGKDNKPLSAAQAAALWNK